MNSRGQFSIIAALLVAVILIATVIATYSTIRNSPIQSQPQLLSAIDETNLAIKQVLGFTVGYYGSILQVTGNTSYAKTAASTYLQSGLVNIANMHPDWGASFNESRLDLNTYWYSNSSFSAGNLGITYNLTGLGVYGITYQTSCELDVQIMNTVNNQACLNVTQDQSEPLINLGKQNFKFYQYQNASSTWSLVNPDLQPVIYSNGTYQISLPSGVDPDSYVVQVSDPRGIMVVASSFSRYILSMFWNQNYSAIPSSTLVAEMLQNGTIRWLGQNLRLTTQAKPIPPIPVKALHVNQTINGANSEVPFQVEDWTSNYMIPLGLTSNASVFSGRTMLVFLLNYSVPQVTIWWNGSDSAAQTSYAYINRYFTADNPSTGLLTNGILSLSIHDGFQVTSTVGSSSSTAVFMRINNQDSTYGASPAYTIHHGIIRDVLQQEAEWSGGVDNCPNLYAHIVLTLPANATYYTYQLRLMFTTSQQKRNITDLSLIRLTTSTGQLQTENGTDANGYPIVSTSTGLFLNSSTVWAHHWSQVNNGARGMGLMMTDIANQNLYAFDSIAGSKTGAIKVDNTPMIQLLPVAIASANFTYALDLTWCGAIVTFDGTTPIYDANSKAGLWITVEYPPQVAELTQS